MEETIACRGPCKKIWSKFGRSSFLRHIKQAAKCREKYTDTEINDLQESNEQRNLNMNRERKRKNYDPEARNEKYQKTDKSLSFDTILSHFADIFGIILVQNVSKN